MDRQTLRDWGHRYDSEGLAGLANRRAPGPTPRLSAAQEAAVHRWVEEGPDSECNGVVRWRCRDLQDRIERAFGVSLHERAMSKLFAKLRFRRLSVRPYHPQSDPAAQAAFKGGFAELVRAAVTKVVHGIHIEVWFIDEARVGQQGTLTRVWAKRGTRPRAVRDRRYTWTYLFGAVCQRFGKWSNVFQRFRRWVRAGVFDRIVGCVSGEPDFEYALIDGTIVTAHQKASGAKGDPGSGDRLFPRRPDDKNRGSCRRARKPSAPCPAAGAAP
jgi:transposase